MPQVEIENKKLKAVYLVFVSRAVNGRFRRSFK
jgi:hypothetical protein